jgi:hypothetical protein
MYEYMHIFTPFFITCSDSTSMREYVWGMACIRWINLVVVVDCDSNFMSYYGVYPFRCYLTREEKITCAIVLSDS